MQKKLLIGIILILGIICQASNSFAADSSTSTARGVELIKSNDGSGAFQNQEELKKKNEINVSIKLASDKFLEKAYKKVQEKSAMTSQQIENIVGQMWFEETGSFMPDSVKEDFNNYVKKCWEEDQKSELQKLIERWTGKMRTIICKEISGYI